MRSGQDVELAARPVTIERFDLLCAPRSAPPVVDLDVVVECSSGTYIRALARDLGARLQTAGHLTALRRTAIQDDRHRAVRRAGAGPPPVVSAEKVIGDVMPTLQPDADGIDALRNGRRLSLDVPDSTYLVVDSGARGSRWSACATAQTHIEVNAPPEHRTGSGSSRVDRPSVVTIGVFDGVHVGHQALIRHNLQIAQRFDLESVVVTFGPNPSRSCGRTTPLPGCVNCPDVWS